MTHIAVQLSCLQSAVASCPDSRSTLRCTSQCSEFGRYFCFSQQVPPLCVKHLTCINCLFTFALVALRSDCDGNGAGLRSVTAQLFPVGVPYFYMATESAQTCQDVCTYGGVTNMTNYFFTGFFNGQPTSLCALSIDGSWIPGSQLGNSTNCSVVVKDSSSTSDGMACACMSTSNTVGLADPNGRSCSDACYNSPFGQGASLPGSGSGHANEYACISTQNVGISNSFGNVILDSSSGNSSCLTASSTGGQATQSSAFSCACVFPTSFRRKLRLHRKDLAPLTASA